MHLFSLLAAAAACVALTSADTATEPELPMTHLKSHSLYLPYVDNDLRIRYWDYGGHTILNTNKHIRLTSDNPSRQGWLWSRLTLPDNGWQVDFEFNVYGYNSHIYGDGMALWATTQRAVPGPVFGNQDYFNGLGLFFDTYSNGNTAHQFPYVSAMIGDGRKPYDHANDGQRDELSGCVYDFRGQDKNVRARITYFKGVMLRLEFTMDQTGPWYDCFNVKGVTLPDKLFLGMSAATGGVSDNHDVNYISTNEITAKPPSSASGSTPSTVAGGIGGHFTGNFGSTHGDADSGSSAFGFIMKLFLFAGICGAGYVGYTMYQQKSNKRF